MKKFKKLAVLLLAVITVFAMAMPGIAAQGTMIGGTGTPKDTDKGKVTISNVYEANAEVTAYQISKGIYDNGFKGYKVTEDGVKTHWTSSEDYSSITYDEVMALANDQVLLNTLPKEVIEAKSGVAGTYEDSLTAGYWIVKIVGTDATKIYNPMIIGVYYQTGDTTQKDKVVSGKGQIYIDTDNKEYYLDGSEAKYVSDDSAVPSEKIPAEPVKATEDTSKTGEYLYMDPTPIDANTSNWGMGATPAVAKQSEITVLKEIEKNSDNDQATDSDKHGDDHGFGDIVTFHGSTNIPAYSKDYKKLKFEITDTMDAHALQLVGSAATPGNDPVKETELAEGETLGNNNTDGTYIKIKVGNYEKDIKNPPAEGKVVFVEAVADDPATPDVDETVAEQSATVTFTDNSFTLSFNEEAIRMNPGAKVDMTYQARILKTADTNFNENENELKVKFTNNHIEDEDGENGEGEIKDKTFHYTFEIDGNLDGETEEGGSHTNKHGHELVKTGEDYGVSANGDTITYKNMAGEEETAKLWRKANGGDDRYYVWDTTANDWKLDAGNKIPAVEWDSEDKTSWSRKTAPMGLAGAKFKLTYVSPEDTFVDKWVYGSDEFASKAEAEAAVAAAQANDPAAPNTITQIRKGEGKTLEQLKQNAVTGKSIYTTTDAGGRLHFTGLDTGYYELEEVTPPDGYSLNSNKVTVRITAEYYNASNLAEGFEIGELKSYKIERAAKAFADVTEADFQSGQTSVYSETRTKEGENINSTVTETYTGADTTFFQNTKMPNLPSTGGTGTMIFTIVGVAILAIAAFLLILRRRRNNEA